MLSDLRVCVCHVYDYLCAARFLCKGLQVAARFVLHCIERIAMHAVPKCACTIHCVQLVHTLGLSEVRIAR